MNHVDAWLSVAIETVEPSRGSRGLACLELPRGTDLVKAAGSTERRPVLPVCGEALIDGDHAVDGR